MNVYYLKLNHSLTTMHMLQNRQKAIYAARTKFTEQHPSIAAAHGWAGDDTSQLYLQMHKTQQTALLVGKKTMTRRVWSDTWARAHQQAHEKQQLVAVLGQGHDTTIGFILYNNIRLSTVSEKISEQDLEAEGGTSTSEDDFRRKWYKDKVTKAPLLPDVVVHVLQFDFYACTRT